MMTLPSSWMVITPKGRHVAFHDVKPTEQEIISRDREIDFMGFDQGDTRFIDEDPDSDGYGWERRALDRAYACS